MVSGRAGRQKPCPGFKGSSHRTEVLRTVHSFLGNQPFDSSLTPLPPLWPPSATRSPCSSSNSPGTFLLRGILHCPCALAESCLPKFPWGPLSNFLKALLECHLLREGSGPSIRFKGVVPPQPQHSLPPAHCLFASYTSPVHVWYRSLLVCRLSICPLECALQEGRLISVVLFGFCSSLPYPQILEQSLA